MGMNASVTVWVGVQDSDISDIVMRLPESFFEYREDETDYEFLYSTISDQLYICEMRVDDELLGIGVCIEYIDWDDSAVKLDLQKLINESTKVRSRMQKIFDECGIKSTIDIFWHTDFS